MALIFDQLTSRQREVFDFIRDKIEHRGYGPTVREIGEEHEQIGDAEGEQQDHGEQPRIGLDRHLTDLFRGRDVEGEDVDLRDPGEVPWASLDVPDGWAAVARLTERYRQRLRELHPDAATSADDDHGEHEHTEQDDRCSNHVGFLFTV
mgnify:CR=1 FL=1